MNLNSKHIYDYHGYRVGDHTRCRNGKCCNLISVGCIQWDFPSTELYNKKETLEEILRKIEELLLNSFPISNVGGGYELYAGVHNGENTFRTLTTADGIIITQNAETIQIGFDTSSIPQQGVTSVAMTVPTGFTVGGSPITSTGTFALNYAAGYTGYTTAEQSKLGGIESGAQVNVPETDPTVPAHVKSILAGDISNWNTAFGWGNHADAGYLTTETDPTVPNHVKAITSTQISNWNTAYAQRIQTFTTTGNSGAATFIGNTLNIPNYTLSGLGGVPLTRNITINGVTQDLSANRTWNIEPDYSALSNQKHLKYDTATGKPVDSNITDIIEGVEVDGTVKTRGVQLNDTTTTPLPNQITRNGKKAQYTNDVGVTENIQVGSNVFVYTPTANFTISAIKTAMETAGKNFNDSHIIIALGSNSYTCSIDLNAPNYIFTLGKLGSGSILFSSVRTLDSGEDAITIMTGNESSMALITCGTTVDYLKIRNY